MKRIGAFILIGCLLLTLCACESSEERWRRESEERVQKINENIERNKQQSEKLVRDARELADIMNGK